MQSFDTHPIYEFLKDGVNVTINTDNRVVSNTDMTNETQIIFNHFNITYDDYIRIYNMSVDSSFADEKVKKKLRIDNKILRVV